MKHFTGDEVGAQGAAVEETRALVKKLEGAEPLDPDTAATVWNSRFTTEWPFCIWTGTE